MTRIEIKARNVASSPGCVSETVTIAIAYISNPNPVVTPVSDGGVIVDRIIVERKNLHNWLKEQEKLGCVLTGQPLAALFYLYE